MRILLALLVCLLAAATPASAARVGAGGFVVAGPVLAGEDIVWADRQSQFAGTVTVRRLTADGLTDTELAVSGCSTELDLAASADYIALTGCEQEVVLAGVGSTPDPTATACEGPVDVTATFLVALGCSGSTGIRALDLTKDRQVELPPRIDSDFTPEQLRIAGRRIALLGEREPTSTTGATQPSVAVYDRGGTAPLYELGLGSLTGDSATFGDPVLRVALQDDGTVLVGAGAPGSTDVDYAWASTSEPFLHGISGDFARTAGRVSLVDGRFASAVGGEDGSDGSQTIAIFDLEGEQQASFDAAAFPDSVERGVVFDGARLGWTTRFVVVRNETLADVDPVAAAPRVVIAAPRGTRRSRRLEFVSGTARDADGAVAEVRVGIARLRGCRRVDGAGRLGRPRRSRGPCRPAAGQVAQGTGAWSFPLKRRLPPGRYVARAVARDYTGLTGSARRTFRVTR